MTITIDSIQSRPNNKIQVGLRCTATDGRISNPQERDIDADIYNADPAGTIAEFTAECLEYFEAFDKLVPEKMGEILADPEPLKGSIVDHRSQAVLAEKAKIEATKEKP